MQLIHVEAKSDEKIDLKPDEIEKLPKKIALFTAVQFIGELKNIKKQLEKAGKEVVLIKPSHCKYPGQLLGCSIENFNNGVKAFLYIGDGMFHPKTLMLINQKPVFTYNPFSKKLKKLNKGDIESIKQRTKAALMKFVVSKDVGIIISQKHGQNRLSEAKKLKVLFPEKDFYFFIADTIELAGLANFPFVDVWVNTACPRIGYDDQESLNRPIINLDDVLKLK